ncbi:zinc finger domain-containing protein [Streptomyces sp. NPDC054786]
MSRAVPPTVREKARTRTCLHCRAAPGEECVPDRAGRSRLHPGRIQDAERALAPLPPYRILPPDMEQDRKHFELDPDSADTLVVFAPTPVGHGILDFLTQLVNGVTRAGQ